ncbi:MAG: guanylate kinase [Lachnospiraceae bacterium]|nr:guanylate kinase [Lachnospiraceae bacterium]
MGKIFYVMGKSSSGKDSIFKKIQEEAPNLQTIVPYTTRPIREDETEGVEYFFVSESELSSMVREDKVVEVRSYETVHGVWRYFTVDDGQIDLENDNYYLMIGTLESYDRIRKYYGNTKVIPVYIEVEDGERLERALKRERAQKTPKYDEMCRRFMADNKDFSDENILECGIKKRYINDDRDRCAKEIAEMIKAQM